MNSDILWSILFWLYVAATAVQLGVWWGIFGRLGIADCGLERTDGFPFPSPIPNPQSPISIILCARNEAANLRRHLPKILRQEYTGEWEVIVVDDASEDETSTVLQTFQEKYPRLWVVRVFEKKQAGKKHALAQGIAAARFDRLLFTDADCEPASPFWLARMAAALTEKPETEIVLGYGPITPAIPRENLNIGHWSLKIGHFLHFKFNKCTMFNDQFSMRKSCIAGLGLNGWCRFETTHTAIQYLSFALAGMPYMGVGRNLAFKKSAYDRAGGFSAHADIPSGDDDLLVNAVATPENTAICIHPESFMYSESPPTWRAWARQKRRHLAAGRRYRPLHQAVLALVSLSHALHFFLLAVLLGAGFGMVSVVLLYLARSGSVLYVYSRILPALREFHSFSRLPIYDALLAAHYGAFVPLFLIAPHSARSAWK
ncbi:MAG: hypothetical protein EPGJADBJ_01457 [Saprospiraceae bacterium]|nr:hypothetical protein [Saprospiraceae bacterium]